MRMDNERSNIALPSPCDARWGDLGSRRERRGKRWSSVGQSIGRSDRGRSAREPLGEKMTCRWLLGRAMSGSRPSLEFRVADDGEP